MNLEPLLAASRATDDFKHSVREYSTRGKAPLVEAGGFAPPIKVLRVVAQLLEAEPMLTLERVRVEGRAGCSDFRGCVEAHAEGVVRQWTFVWCCKWRAAEQGWIDCFGFPDQMRAAREFGYRCFEIWERVPAAPHTISPLAPAVARAGEEDSLPSRVPKSLSPLQA